MKLHHLKPITAVLLAGLAQSALASGYHFGTQSVIAQSTANSSAAEAADASTLFHNPAGLSKLDSHEITAAINLVAPSIKYEATSAKHLDGRDVTGSTSGKITDDVVAAPHLYGAYKLNDRTTLGLGIYVPFASGTEYDNDSVLRYNMNKLNLTSIAIEPAVAYQATDKLSLAAGVIAQHSKAELRKYADFGLSQGLAGKADGYSEIKGDDWGYGFHLAGLYDINDQARIGFNYRSKIEHNLKGEANWVPASLGAEAAQARLVAGGYVATEDANVRIITPESLSVHGMYRLNKQVNLFGDVTWTRHSRFNTANLYFENQKVIGSGTSNSTTLKPNWRDTIRVSAGASYQYSEPLQFRAGLAFDQSPIRGASDRLITLPDGNRIWFSAGMKYTHNQRHVFDVAYTHIHINDTDVNASAATGKDVDSKGPVSAKFKNYANIFGVQYSYKF